MSEPLVSIPLSLAKELRDDCLDLADMSKTLLVKETYMDQVHQLRSAIAKAEREASLDQLSAIDQDRYKDTVNPLVRPSNE